MFSHPASQGITTQDYWQLAAWQFEGGSCFWDANMDIRPHGQAFLDLVHKRWKTVDAGPADASGVRAMRGFLGDYAITVTAGDRQPEQGLLPVSANTTPAHSGTPGGYPDDRGLSCVTPTPWSSSSSSSPSSPSSPPEPSVIWQPPHRGLP